jgi:hypothetical protein
MRIAVTLSMANAYRRTWNVKETVKPVSWYLMGGSVPEIVGLDHLQVLTLHERRPIIDRT